MGEHHGAEEHQPRAGHKPGSRPSSGLPGCGKIDVDCGFFNRMYDLYPAQAAPTGQLMLDFHQYPRSQKLDLKLLRARVGMGVPGKPTPFPYDESTKNIAFRHTDSTRRSPKSEMDGPGWKKGALAPGGAHCWNEVKDKASTTSGLSLSGGQQQAALHRPAPWSVAARRVIPVFGNEPCSALDPILDRQRSRELIQEKLGRGLNPTIAPSSHNNCTKACSRSRGRRSPTKDPPSCYLGDLDRVRRDQQDIPLHRADRRTQALHHQPAASAEEWKHGFLNTPPRRFDSDLQEIDPAWWPRWAVLGRSA